MNIEDMMKNMNPKALSEAMQRMGKILEPSQMEQVKKTIQSADKGTLNQKLNHLTAEDLKRELMQNPALAKQLANNPDVMQKINQIFQKK